MGRMVVYSIAYMSVAYRVVLPHSELLLLLHLGCFEELCEALGADASRHHDEHNSREHEQWQVEHIEERQR